MYNAKKYGYILNIIKGYTFNKGNSFSGYVKYIYDLRMKYLKSDPMNQIAKLLNNSLYGYER